MILKLEAHNVTNKKHGSTIEPPQTSLLATEIKLFGVTLQQVSWKLNCNRSWCNLSTATEPPQTSLLAAEINSCNFTQRLVAAEIKLIGVMSHKVWWQLR